MYIRPSIAGIIVATVLLVAAIVWRARYPSTEGAAIRGNDPVEAVSAQPMAVFGQKAPIHDEPSNGVFQLFCSQPLPSTLRQQGVATVGEAWALVRQLPVNADRSAYLLSLLRFCLEIDPAATTDTAAELADLPLRDLGVKFALETWAERDATAALIWAVSHPRGDDDAIWFDAVCKSFSARPTDEALAFLQRPELGANVATLARSLVFHYDERGRLVDLFASIEHLDEGTVRDTLIGQVAHFWAQRDLHTAVVWLENMGSDRTFSEGMTAIVQAIAPAEPVTAMEAAQQIPSGQSGRDTLSDLVYLWAKRDLGGVAVWLKTQPPNPSLDAAIGLLAEESAFVDPIEARTWLRTMTDSQNRTELARRLGIEI